MLKLPPLSLKLPSLSLPPLPGGARLWVSLLSFGFVFAALLGNGQQLLALRLDPQGWLWLMIGVGISLLSLAVNGLAWTVGLRWLGFRPAWAACLRFYLRSNLLKYLPGGIWHLAARVQLLRQAADPSPGGAGPLLSAPLPTPQALVAVLLDPVLAASAALLLLGLGGWQNGLALLALVPIVVLMPRWLNPLLGRMERRRARQLGLEELDQANGAAQPFALPGYPLLPLLPQFGFVLLRFGGFACCVLAFDQQLSLGWPSWLAGFLLAWTVGLVVPGAPGGLGVFEAVLLLRLGAELPEAPLLAVALSYRLVATLADLLAALTARLDGALAAAARA
ncbi:flippase-like domain-containing protein [Synechococcus sp. Tobar12-5m-g]|jgi:uncharacterized membrane protein YbhN (UPF0104 family)|uniref:lysylphosphatidylglycerol synthase domain-containing protein n=1 Tax=unclassified Synechococcus TaxID=2626047 RepID=UPI0020CE4551|nr:MULTISPECIES: lysylphosphatidylglycerol synthase domain-containing protein [unclassified Synechococcus]MCP9771546.1 flippase-like domain-containing protein [Synechococcus sp. Tobar12-5m-g]MCP9872486.1 flippase-like domain-containing protein [Synechococcus sp. Cruz CV-v-12]